MLTMQRNAQADNRILPGRGRLQTRYSLSQGGGPEAVNSVAFRNAEHSAHMYSVRATPLIDTFADRGVSPLERSTLSLSRVERHPPKLDRTCCDPQKFPRRGVLQTNMTARTGRI